MKSFIPFRYNVVFSLLGSGTLGVLFELGVPPLGCSPTVVLRETGRTQVRLASRVPQPSLLRIPRDRQPMPQPQRNPKGILLAAPLKAADLVDSR